MQQLFTFQHNRFSNRETQVFSHYFKEHYTMKMLDLNSAFNKLFYTCKVILLKIQTTNGLNRYLLSCYFQSFPSPRLVASPRLKNLVCPTIYP